MKFFKSSISKNIMTHWRLKWWLTIFSNKEFLIKVCTYWVFRHNAIVLRVQYNVNITFICTGKPENSCGSLYCNICFIYGDLEPNSVFRRCACDLPDGNPGCFRIHASAFTLWRWLPETPCVFCIPSSHHLMTWGIQ